MSHPTRTPDLCSGALVSSRPGAIALSSGLPFIIPQFPCREIKHLDSTVSHLVATDSGMMVSSPLISANVERLDTIMQIISANTILYCRKWEETVAFYQTGLQLPVTVSTEWFVEFQLTTTSRLSVADESRTSIKSSDGKGVTVGLQVEDIVAAHSQLKGAGLNPTALKQVWGAEAFYVFDPEGNRIEFWSGRAKS